MEFQYYQCKHTHAYNNKIKINHQKQTFLTTVSVLGCPLAYLEALVAYYSQLKEHPFEPTKSEMQQLQVILLAHNGNISMYVALDYISDSHSPVAGLQSIVRQCPAAQQ